MNFVKDKIKVLSEESIIRCILDWQKLNSSNEVDESSLLYMVTKDVICSTELSDIEFVAMACYDIIFDYYIGKR